MTALFCCSKNSPGKSQTPPPWMDPSLKRRCVLRVGLSFLLWTSHDLVACWASVAEWGISVREGLIFGWGCHDWLVPLSPLSWILKIVKKDEFSTKCNQTDHHRMSGGRQEVSLYPFCAHGADVSLNGLTSPACHQQEDFIPWFILTLLAQKAHLTILSEMASCACVYTSTSSYFPLPLRMNDRKEIVFSS